VDVFDGRAEQVGERRRAQGTGHRAKGKRRRAQGKRYEKHEKKKRRMGEGVNGRMGKFTAAPR